MQCGDQQQLQTQQLQVSRGSRKCETVNFFFFLLEHLKWTCYDLLFIYLFIGAIWWGYRQRG